MRSMLFITVTDFSFLVDQCRRHDECGCLNSWQGSIKFPPPKPGRDSANMKHLYIICTMLAQRRRRWADVAQMLYKCFVIAGEKSGPGFDVMG